MMGLLKRVLRQTVNDRRTFALMLVAPLLLSGLLYLLLGESTYVPNIYLDDSVSTAVADAIAEQDIAIIDSVGGSADGALRDGDIDAVISMGDDGITVRMLQAGNTRTAPVIQALRDTIASLVEDMANAPAGNGSSAAAIPVDVVALPNGPFAIGIPQSVPSVITAAIGATNGLSALEFANAEDPATELRAGRVDAVVEYRSDGKVNLTMLTSADGRADTIAEIVGNALATIGPGASAPTQDFLETRSPGRPVIGISPSLSSAMFGAVEQLGTDIFQYPNGEDSDTVLRTGLVDMEVAYAADGSLVLRVLDGNEAVAQRYQAPLATAMAAIAGNGTPSPTPTPTPPATDGVLTPASLQMNVEYLYGEADASFFDSFAYVVLGYLAFFFVFLLSGISFVRERTTGTLERLMMTPIKRWQVIVGYTAGFGLFAIAQSSLMLLFTIYVLGLEVAGSVWLALAVMVLIAIVAVSLGTLASIFANNEFQLMQFIPIAIVPQMFFTGIIDPATFPYHLGVLAYGMPVYYGARALNAIINRGEGFAFIWGDLAALAAFALVVSLINVLALKKYRRL